MNDRRLLNKPQRKLIIEKYSIDELIPHSEPMVLIDRIIDFDHDSLIAETKITENSLFYHKESIGVPSWVGIEYMAQAIACFAGVQDKINNQPIKLGFLLGTREYKISKNIMVLGCIYLIQIKKLYMDDSGLASFECKILSDDEIYAEAKLNVFETDDIKIMIEKKP